MAFRVDDLVVSDKNVYLVSENRQFYTDIEKTSDAKIDEYKNAWNLSLSDGSILHNIFDSSDVDIQSQIYRRGKNDITKEYEYAHLDTYAPSNTNVIGLTQLFDNAYSVTNTTTNSISSIIYTNNSMNTSETFVDEQAICKYDSVNNIINNIENYVSNQASLKVKDGLQYLIEYPFGKYYGEFGDNETLDRITVYGDAINVKNHLNENYSVEGIDSKNENTVNSYFKKFRTYYNVGSTGNSIYLVYKNDLNGHASYNINQEISPTTANAIQPRFYTISMLSDFIMIETTDKLYCANSIDELFLKSDKDIRTDYNEGDNKYTYPDYTSIATPHNGSFSVRVNKRDNYKLCYIPRIGNLDLYSSYLPGETGVSRMDNVGYIPFDNNVFCYYYESSDRDGNHYSPPYHKFINIVGNEQNKDYTKIFYTPVIGNKITYYTNVLDKITLFKAEKLTDNVLAIIGWYNGDFYLFVSSPVDGITGNYFKLVVPPFFQETTYTEPSSSDILNSSSTEVITTDDGDNVVTTKNIYAYGALSDGVSSITETVETRTARGYLTSSTTTTKLLYPSGESISVFNPDDIESYKDYTINAFSKGTAPKQPSNISVSILQRDCGEQKPGTYVFVHFYNFDKQYDELTYFRIEDIDDNLPYIKTTSTGPVNTIETNDNTRRFFVKSYFTNPPDTVDSNIGYYIDYAGEHKLDKRYSISGGLISVFNNYEKNLSGEMEDSGSNVSFSPFPLCERDKIEENKNNLVKIYVDDDNIIEDNKKYLFNYEINNSMFKPGLVYTYNNELSIIEAILSSSDHGYHLVYSGICTEVYVETSIDTENISDKQEKRYKSTIYQYPHPCYGKLATAGTHLPIFDGKLLGQIGIDNYNTCRIINGYFVCMNYNVDSVSAHTPEEVKESVRVSLSPVPIDKYPTGGYVVTDNLLNTTDVSKLYSAELKYTNEEYNKDNYVQLWHVRPTGYVEFYPKSYEDKEWKPYYAGKNIIDIVYAGGFYYIMLTDDTSIGYDIIETPSLFEEQEYTYIADNMKVSNFKTFEKYAVVEYKHKTNSSIRYVKWFKYGYAKYKYDFLYSIGSNQNVSSSSVATGEIELTHTSATLPSKYDNVEQVYSINRFIPNNVHKSQYFSIKVEDLGIDKSDYLSDSQKEFVKMWIKNNITEIVNKNKPAQTELLQVYID